MKLVANNLNQTYLRDILPAISEDIQVEVVLAAIAYGSDSNNAADDLVGHSVKNKLRLDLWMRYDETVPVAVPLLKRLLKHLPDNVFTYFVPDCFHPKVIWWKGYGAYIGSANHTDRAWITNIEAGLFLTEDELVANGIDIELESFFDYLRALDVTIPISADYVAEMEAMAKARVDAYKESRKIRSHPEWGGPAFFAKKTAFDKRKENFRKEWLSTLGILKSIEALLPEYRPEWIGKDVPYAWQADQFLHAYYYNRVGDKLRKPYEEYYDQHKSNPNGELKEQLEWWAGLERAPSHEDDNLDTNAPAIRTLLQKNKVLTLTAAEFAQLCSKTHATLDHISKVPMSVFGRADVASMEMEGRVELFAPFILAERNQKGWDVRQLLHYVLHEGADKDIWERIYHAGRDSQYSIARYGLNSIAEVVGWARPEIAPPRNGRTSKALRALGFDVKVY